MSFCRVRRARTEIVLIMAMALLFALAIPASAQTEGGTGVGTGTEHIVAEEEEPAPPLCAEVFADQSTYEEDTGEQGDYHYFIDALGTYTGLPEAVYEGELEFTITATENYFIAPEGTYGDRDEDTGECDPATLGPLDPVEADFTVYQPGFIEDANGEACDGSGTFYRVNTTFVAQWDLDEACEVDGNVPGFAGEGEAPEGTTHTFEGNLAPCTPFACPDPQLEIAYEQTLH